jgi:hypothetical protein
LEHLRTHIARNTQVDIGDPPNLPPIAGLPNDRPLPLPLDLDPLDVGLNGSAGSCDALTPAAIQAVIDTILGSIDQAKLDVKANGVLGTYASAARDNLTYLTEANDKMLVLQDWLKSVGVDEPFVTNATGAYNVHGYVREAIIPLHYARHWAMISTVYHNSTNARDSFELTTTALDLIEPLGAQAGRCYMGTSGIST